MACIYGMTFVPLYIYRQRGQLNRLGSSLRSQLSEFSLYLYIYIYIYIFQAVRRARAVNALRANVGPAGWGSTVNTRKRYSVGARLSGRTQL